MFTFVIIDSVIALELERDAAVDALPAFVAAAAPLTVRCGFARTVFGTFLWAAFKSAMFAVPARHAQARAVLTLPVLVAPVKLEGNKLWR